MNNTSKIIFLGTGHAHVINCYNTCFLYCNNDHLFLTDSGGGNFILSQLEKINIPVSDIHHMFISHSHTDHILGAIWIVRLYGASIASGNIKPLNIYGNKDVINKLRDICDSLIQDLYKAYFDKLIIFNTVESGISLDFYDDNITFFDTKAITTPQLGYKIIMSNKKSLLFCGDEPYRLSDSSFIQDADWVIYENTCIFCNPYFEGIHSCTKESCSLAQKYRIKNLILTHTEDLPNSERKELVLSEGSQYYDGNLFCPDDLDVIDLI